MKRKIWIDVLRGIAIIAVVLDHAIFLHPSYRIHPLIQSHLYFSLVFFIFLSGFTNALSAERKLWKFPQSVLLFWKNKKGLALTFVIASIISTRYYHGNFDLYGIWVDITYFSAQRPYYFFGLLFRLYFLFPFLFMFYQLMGKGRKYIGLLSIIIISFVLYFISQSSQLRWISGYPTFAAYFFIFYLGMLSSSFHLKWNRLLGTGVILLFLFFELYLIVMYGTIFRDIPIIPLFGWSLTVLILVKLFQDIVGIDSLVATLLAFVGKHSYYIFLFHFLILSSLTKIYDNSIVNFTRGFILAIFLPIILEYAMSRSFTFLSLLLRERV